MSAVRNYAIVTASYWSFTLTDGALRMLVLLHFYGLGYTPFMLAFLFLLYETAGIFANLGGGWLAARFGIPRMLMTGLRLQIAGLIMLSGLIRSGARLSVAWVVAAQGIAGVAKDLTKTASKSAIKATSQGGAGSVPVGRVVHRLEERHEGRRFFVGGFLLQVAGSAGALADGRSAGGRAGRRRFLATHPRQGQGIQVASGNSSPKRVASISSPAPGSSCSARAMSGSSSDCRSFFTRKAGATWGLPGSWPVGQSGMGLSRPSRRTS